MAPGLQKISHRPFLKVLFWEPAWNPAYPERKRWAAVKRKKRKLIDNCSIPRPL